MGFAFQSNVILSLFTILQLAMRPHAVFLGAIFKFLIMVHVFSNVDLVDDNDDIG